MHTVSGEKLWYTRFLARNRVMGLGSGIENVLGTQVAFLRHCFFKKNKTPCCCFLKKVFLKQVATLGLL